ncbi:hypothetical protein BBI00_11310 [Chryseobacterium arthrosphaerae]|uniref:Uncharacterized protein n=1 Tax=Chryseobacterium arthrosphaerae TaxID=651561 RepID=A0A1B8ZTH2_9FLAO|nr:hypothetical protein BBI00_11310 [Chryseobacterium arthrosphaerae]
MDIIIAAEIPATETSAEAELAVEPEAEELIVTNLNVFVWKENQVVDVFTYKNTCFINKSGFYRSFLFKTFIVKEFS